MNWIYKNNIFQPEDISRYFGFIYKLVYSDGSSITYSYYGKKQINSYNEKDVLLNGSKRKGHVKFLNRNRNGKRVKKELVCSESNYKAYAGSCKDDRVKSMQLLSKEILELVEYSDKAKTTLSYLEENYLHKKDVLFDKYNLNGNIASRYYVGRIENDKGI